MRRTRGFAWYHVLFAIPALAVAFGIQYFMRAHFPSSPNSEVTAVTKPSQFKNEQRSVASDETAIAETHATHEETAKPSKKKKHEEKMPAETAWENPKTEARHDSTHHAAAPETARVESGRRETAPVEKHVIAETGSEGRFRDAGEMHRTQHAVREAGEKLASPKAQRMSSAPETTVSSNAGFTDRVDADGLNTAQTAAHSSGAQCMSVEYRGDGPNSVITPKDWSKVVDQFLEAKKDLTQWMERNRKGFPEKTLALMDRQLRTVKLQKPPVPEEADLAWRGIGIYGQDTTRNPVVRIGPGFVKLAVHQPARAKFEMMRLLAQTWAPCELAKEDAFEPWAPLLSCLQVSEKTACTVGSVSESGWAVSSSLAAMLAPPGCGVPAFRDPAMAKCLQKFPFPLGTQAAQIAHQAAETAERSIASTLTPVAPAAPVGAAPTTTTEHTASKVTNETTTTVKVNFAVPAAEHAPGHATEVKHEEKH